MIANWRVVDICQLSFEKLESIFFGVASYLGLGDGISLDLGDENQLGLVVRWSVPLLSDMTSYCGS